TTSFAPSSSPSQCPPCGRRRPGTPPWGAPASPAAAHMAAVVAPPSTGAPQPRRPASVGRRHPPLYISLTRGPICPTPSDPPFPYTFTPTPSPQTPLAEATTRSTNRGPRVHETVPEPAPSHCVSQRENARCSRAQPRSSRK
uniref:Uncharacterized protein n=1 Tax=Setaria italica TaxID=4555 RepID=A0A0Q3QF20_SETIT